MNRPLVWVALALVAGLWSAARGLAPGLVIPLLPCLTGLAVLASFRSHAWAQPAGVALLFFGAGALWWNARHADPPGDALSGLASLDENLYELEGRVRWSRLLTPGEDYLRFVIDVDQARQGGRTWDLQGRTEVRWAGAVRPVHPDQRVRVRGRLSPVLGPVNFGVGGFDAYLRRRGVHTALEARGPGGVEVRGPGRWWRPAYAASRLRHAQSERFAVTVPEAARPFVWTVWLGDSFRASPGAYRAFVESGTAHVLAVSGLHMGIVYASAAFTLRMLVRRPRLRVGLALAAVWAFALTAGAQVSCTRAAVMLTLYLTAELLGRESDAPTALAVSALLFLMVNPDLLFDVGFLLSFTSVASILLYAGPLADALARLPYFLRASFGTTLAVQILSTPVAVSHFHVLPWVAPLANLLVVPLLAAVLWLAFATSALAFVSIDVAALFGHALAPLVWLIRELTRVVSTPAVSHLVVIRPGLPALACYAGAAAMAYAALQPGRRRRRAVAAALVLAAATVLAWPLRDRPALVDFLDVGQGDASFIRTAQGATVLIDGGNATPDWNVGERIVAPYLRAQGVRRLDLVAATHPDRDHIGGLPYIVERFPVGQVLLPWRAVPDEREKPLLDLCRRKGVSVRRLKGGDRVDLNGGRLEVLHPPEHWPDPSSGNNRSLVLRLHWDGPTVLFPGDIEKEAETHAAALDCRSAVLKAPHHGSRTSSTPGFLIAVAPRDCVVSSGPRGEVADRDVMDRYRALGIRLWRTDTMGGIRLLPGEQGYRIEAARGGRVLQ